MKAIYFMRLLVTFLLFFAIFTSKVASTSNFTVGGTTQVYSKKVLNLKRQVGSSKFEYFNKALEVNGVIDKQAYVDLCIFLRDNKAQRMYWMDYRLLNLLWKIQATVENQGFRNSITILSGFRTVGTNLELAGAAPNSQHLYGRAIDFRLDGYPLDVLHKWAVYFRAGGVGYYPPKNPNSKGFIHIDVGPIRYWTR